MRRGADSEVAIRCAGLREGGVRGLRANGGGQRADGDARPVVLLREVHGNHGLRVWSNELSQRRRGLVIREVAVVSRDALLEKARVGARREHALVMVALKRENAHTGEQLERAVSQHARVRAKTEGIRLVALAAIEAQAKRIRHVVRGGEGAHAHPARLELIRITHELERQLREVLASARGAGRGDKTPLILVAEDGEAAHVVRVLVRDDDAADAIHVDAQLVRAAEELPAREAVVDKDGTGGALHHGRIALRAAGQNVKVHLRHHRRAPSCM